MSENLFYYKDDDIIIDSNIREYLTELNKRYGYKVFGTTVYNTMWNSESIDFQKASSYSRDDKRGKAYLLGRDNIPTATAFMHDINNQTAYFFTTNNQYKRQGYNRNSMRSVNLKNLLNKIKTIINDEDTYRYFTPYVADELTTAVADINAINSRIQDENFRGIKLKELLQVALGEISLADMNTQIKQDAQLSLDKIKQLEQTSKSGLSNLTTRLNEKGFYMVGINRVMPNQYVIGKGFLEFKNDLPVSRNARFARVENMHSVKDIANSIYANEILGILTMYKISRDDYLTKQGKVIPMDIPYHYLDSWGRQGIKDEELGVYTMHSNQGQEFTYEWLALTDVQ